MTVSERKLWWALRKLGLHVRRQAPIGRYVADFVLHDLALVIELDGPRHDLPEAQLHDALRDQWLSSQGYRVLRFRNEQALYDPDGVVKAIRGTLPPRWGKGRDGGEGSAIRDMTLEADPPLESIRRRRGCTPTLPSPIEGEGES